MQRLSWKFPPNLYTHSVFFIRNLKTFLNWFSSINNQTNLKYGNALSVPTKFFPHRKTKHSFVNTGIFVCLVDLNPAHMFICWCLSTSECKCVTSLPVLINISCKHVLKPHVLIIGTCSTLLQPQISLWSQSICT